jgi:hypothetical protein
MDVLAGDLFYEWLDEKALSFITRNGLEGGGCQALKGFLGSGC